MRLLKISIPLKLLIIFILISLLPSLVSALILSRLLFNRIEEETIARTRESLKISEKMLFAYIDRVADDVHLISDMAEIREPLKEGNAFALPYMATKISRRLITALVEVFGPDGSILARGEPSVFSPIKDIVSSPQEFHVRSAMNYEKKSSLVKIKDMLVFRAASPVVDESYNLLGVVLVTYPVSENFVDEVKHVTGTDISVFIADKLISTSLDDKGGRLKKYPVMDKVKETFNHSDSLFSTDLILGLPYSTGYSLIDDYEDNATAVVAVALPKEHILKLQDSSRNYIMIIALFTFLLAVLLSLLMSRGISEALKKLLKVVRSVAQGDLSAQIKFNRDDEIDELANAFNLMTDELRRSHEKLEDYNHNLEDIVEQRTAELKKAQNQLILSEKMSAIGQLSAGIVHEINNPIGFVLSNLEALHDYNVDLLKMTHQIDDEFANASKDNDPTALRLKDFYENCKNAIDFEYLNDDLIDLLEETISGVKRMQTIVENLKTFAHPGEDTFKPADLNFEIESALSLVWNKLKYNCKVVKDFETLPMINCNAGQLVQVFVNLLINASHAIEKQGTITITTRDNDEYVMLQFSDTGKGIDPEHIDSIFEPFFTTKERGKGTGLGLSLAYEFIQKNNGVIDVDSTLGGGTVFTIKLFKEMESDE